jgi:hypothetical protein
VYGDNMRDHAIYTMHNALKQCCQEYLADADLVYTEKLEDSGFFTLFHRQDMNLKTLADLATTFRLSVRRAVNREVVKLTGQKLKSGPDTASCAAGPVRTRLTFCTRDCVTRKKSRPEP